MSDKLSIEMQAKCWRFITHKNFIECVPYDTDGDFSGYRVGLQKKGMTVNAAIMGSGDTLQAAVLEAVKKWKEKSK